MGPFELEYRWHFGRLTPYMETYVYALNIHGTHFIKIGCSLTPDVRRRNFQSILKKTGNTCFVLCQQAVWDMSWMYEFALHQHFAAYRICLEWFCAPPAVIQAAFEPQALHRIYTTAADEDRLPPRYYHRSQRPRRDRLPDPELC